MRYIVLISIFLSFLIARENPFEPVFKKSSSNASKKFEIAKFEIPKIKPFKWISFIIDNSSITIETKDKIKKVFSIKNPDKIVVDFRSKRSFPTKKIEDVKSEYLENIIIGSHKNYYRVAIKLKKRVKYKLKKEDGKYIIEIEE